MGFWENVDELVIQQKTTYRWVALKVPTSETTVSGWRRTGVLPRADQAVAIASALGVSVEYLVTGITPDVDVQWYTAHRQLIEDLKALTPDQLDTIATTAGVQAAKNRAAAGDDHANGTGSA